MPKAKRPVGRSLSISHEIRRICARRSSTTSAREQLAKEIKQALKQIDKGNEKVLDKKFEELSDGVHEWWDLLRPEELSFFSGVIPRPGARRTIDFKAGLSVSADRSIPSCVTLSPCSACPSFIALGFRCSSRAR